MFEQNNPIRLAYSLSHQDLRERAEYITAQYGITLVPLESKEAEGILPILKITKNQLALEHQGDTLFFHPSMSLLRMVNIMRGNGDRFLQACDITEGDTFLDATMGLASDTLIAAWAVGEKGKVMALEVSSLIHMLVDDGLHRLEKLRPPGTSKEKEEAWDILSRTSSRIETRCCHHRRFLEELPDAAVDIIYFDPMFRQTVEQSAAIKPLKNWSNSEPLSPDTIQQACRVARKRVVMKERKTSGEFERLGFEISAGSRYNPIAFGTINLTERRERSCCCP
jgi:hypothetical protein